MQHATVHANDADESAIWRLTIQAHVRLQEPLHMWSGMACCDPASCHGGVTDAPNAHPLTAR